MFYKIENKQLDLLAAYNRKEGPSSVEKYVKMFIAPVLLIIIIGASWTLLFLSNKNTQSKIDDINQQNQIIQSQIDASDLDAYQELTTLEGTFASLEQVDAYISALPRVTREKVRYLQTSLLNGMSIQSLSYNQETGVISASCQSVYVNNIEKYVSKIKTNPDYLNVSYKGYQQSTQTNTIDTGTVDPLTGLPVTTQSTSTYYTFSISVAIGGGE